MDDLNLDIEFDNLESTELDEADVLELQSLDFDSLDDVDEKEIPEVSGDFTEIIKQIESIDFDDEYVSPEEEKIIEKNNINEEKYLQEVAFSLAQYYKLYNIEISKTKQTIDISNIYQPRLNNSPESKIIKVYNETIHDSKEETLTAWLYNDLTYISNKLNDTTREQLKLLTTIREKILSTYYGKSENNSEYYSYVEKLVQEFIRQKISRIRSQQKFDSLKDEELSVLKSEIENAIVIGDSFFNTKSMLDLPIRVSNDVTEVVIYDKEDLEKYTLVSKIMVDTSGNLLYQCSCGEILEAKEAIVYITQKKINYIKVRPVTCSKCGKKVILDQKLLYLLLLKCVEVAKSEVLSVVSSKIYVDTYILHKVYSFEGTKELEETISKIDTDICIKDNIELDDDRDTFIQSFITLINNQKLKPENMDREETVLDNYILEANNIDVDIRHLVNYIYSKLDSTFKDTVSLSNKTITFKNNAEKVKIVLRELSKDKRYTPYIINKQFLSEKFLFATQQIKPIKIHATLKKYVDSHIQEIIDGITIDSYLECVLSKSEESQVYFSCLGEYIEDLLFKDNYREDLLSNLVSSFIFKYINKSVIKAPFKLKASKELLSEVSRYENNNIQIRGYDLLSIVGYDRSNIRYVSYKMYEDTSKRYYTNYVPYICVAFPGEYAKWIKYIEGLSFDGIKNFYIGDTTEEDARENNIARKLLLYSLLKSLDKRQWKDERMISEILPYLESEIET